MLIQGNFRRACTGACRSELQQSPTVGFDSYSRLSRLSIEALIKSSSVQPAVDSGIILGLGWLQLQQLQQLLIGCSAANSGRGLAG